MDSLKIILPALIGLLGTLVVAFIGYRQWKRQHALSRAASVLSDKQLAYKTIWNKLEDVHLFVRSEAFDKNRFLELARIVNIEMMRSGLLLERGEKGLVNDYLKALEILARNLDSQEDPEVRQEVRETFYTTAPVPIEVTMKARDLHRAYEDVEEQRELLIQRFRHAIGADMV
jgi:hypothetical protein